MPLVRERAKQPYSLAEIDGYLRLADAQSTRAHGLRASALVCLGAGAGVIAGELRHVRGTDVVARSGGVLVQLAGARARSVPVLERYQQRLSEAAAVAGDRYLIGGRDPDRRNVTDALCAALSTDSSLPRLAGRPAAIHLAYAVRPGDRAWRVHARGRDLLQPAARGPRRPTPRPPPKRSSSGCWEAAPVSAELERIEQIIDASGVARRIELLLPIGVRPRQLSVRTLLTGMLLAAVHGRPAHLRRVHQALPRPRRPRPAPARDHHPVDDRTAPAHLPPT